ncbi:nucleotidyltransferase family protein [Bacillus sp. SN10]|uniref:nucleotidyltransferase family protein n=1 Tax=Bacillus sp. SN10 TaxID=2056493 RepID=UPI000C33FC2F|nr:nucleotidyltransferase domain-containing protein [Bacillus sp. SN10]PKJ52730.1 DNA polymerase subunit beta [Bacillus sp. SN10]
MIESFSFITNEKHKKLIQKILSEYLFRDKVNGLMLIGSVARGDAYPESDLDFYILLEDRQKKKFYSETREDILVEYKYADVNQILVNFKNNQKKLKGIAISEFENYRVSSDKMKGISHWLHSSLIKIQSALKASYIVQTSTWTLLEGIWAINNKPVPPAGSVLKYIKTLSIVPTNFEDYINRLFLGDTKDCIKAAMELIEWVLHK